MPKSSSPALAVPEFRACTECRKRKSKCSGTTPCLYCSRNNKECVFNRAPSRTPLTRRNLDEAEHRCAKLVELLRRLNPDIDSEDALRTVALTSTGSPRPSVDRRLSLDRRGQVSEEADRFDWNEDSSIATPHRGQSRPDGMASLPTGNAEAGYLGTSSGSNILRAISSLLPEPADPDTTHQVSTSTANVPQLETHPAIEQLNNTIVLDTLIDAYFLHYHPSYPILHESIFRQKYHSRREVRMQPSWHPIFYLVLAIGDWIVNGGSGAEQPGYYAAARSRMSMRMLESGNLLTVQAFLLMGNYLQKRDRPNTGYNFIGIAYRMALGLGLHREPPAQTAADTLLNERRRVVWWIVYCFDSGFSLTTGRPVTVLDSFIETRLPRNIDDSGCDLASTLPPPTTQPTIYSSIIAHSRLAIIANTIHRAVISAPANNPATLQTARSLDRRLKAWKLSLPVYFTAHEIPSWFRGPRAILHWKEQNLRMMLWWGSQRTLALPQGGSDGDEAQNMCQYTAIETIQDIATFCIDHANDGTLHPGLAWYAIYFLFQAVIVLSIHQFKPRDPNDVSLAETDQDLWVFSISKARDCLTQLGRSNTAANRCLEVLDRIWSGSRGDPGPAYGAASTQAYAALGEPSATTTTNPDAHTNANPIAYAVDPALQIFLKDASWDNAIFEGLHGFPSTVETDPLYYDFAGDTSGANGGQGYSMFGNMDLEPT
ncbi:fungal-specific transcription factor domain-containing protein [Aspergillus pseudodeflectus]|uniref:Fungal-specific transcription factor domain-containing protein n=1 Tax=Aspergillus pseudodeflectus TaxID=176178 RepID=A0ABR4JZF0_9EURO